MTALDRRRFLAGSASLLAASGTAATTRADASPTRLIAESRSIVVKGKAASILGLRGPSGYGGLRLGKGERFQVELVNGLAESTLVHWHGLTPPSPQDGVPILSQAPLKPGESGYYGFDNRRTGTHWMHSHVGLQEQRLLAAPLIIGEPREGEREHVAMLHDFTFRDPAEILAELRSGGGAHAGHATMGRAVLNDVVFDAYLCNDRSLDDPEIVRIDRGTALTLRIINGAAASNMWIDLGQLEGELVAVDGNPIVPLRGSRFPLAVAQRADIRLFLAATGVWPILFRPEGVQDAAGLLVATPDAAVGKIASPESIAPALDLAMEFQLRAAQPPVPDPVTRTEVVTLTGGGADYAWGLNGKPSMHDTLFSVRPGERVAIIMHNATSMSHPMHLHGHHFQVIEIDGGRIAGAMRDTILVPPKTTVTIAFDADNPGSWAFHCHHLYHMQSGMMGAVGYTTAA